MHMVEIDAVKRKKFLKELTALTRAYGIGIGGCGCCGSPWLTAKQSRTGTYECNDKDERLAYVEKRN